MGASNKALSMQIDAKDGSIARSPSAQVTNDPTAMRSLIAGGKVASFAKPHVGNKLAMIASSDALEASIAAQRVVKESDVTSSPSPLVKSKRLANRYLFAVGKPLLFASPVHLLCCNERFQQRAGSINPRVCSCKRGRRGNVALSACKQLKIGK